ncbi:DUF2875 family protein, partial [Pseudomonas entomophila]|uniref:type VI lipase adapter Tla3 domain-containing protein n=1 Tax=Pseudomonas entomophila TaxID=312306 RepID=UPI0015E488CB
MALRSLKPALAWGIAAFVGWLVIFGMCWRDGIQAYERAKSAAHEKEMAARIAEQQAIQGRSYALEIRGVGLAIHQDGQSKIWQFIKKKEDNFASIYSRDAKDYEPSLDTRRISRDIKIRIAFKNSAGASVAYWPIPVFALGPPDPYEKGYRAEDLINAGRNAATLGVTQFLWQDDESTDHAQGMIERLFAFFDDNPKVPQALIA